jgi:hypothetical protein
MLSSVDALPLRCDYKYIQSYGFNALMVEDIDQV